MSAGTQLVWDLAGRPAPVESAASLLHPVPAPCQVCGERAEQTAPAARALGANFTDQGLYRRPDSDRVCRACLWCASGKPPATLRMWSVVAAPGGALPASAEKAWLQDTPGLHLTNRGNPRALTSTLLSPPAGPWLVTVAISGQKHVVPYADVQHGRDRWSVRVEATTVTSTPTEYAAVLAAAATLRAAGHRDDDVTAGQPTMSALRERADLDWWRTWSAPLARYTRSPLLALALWALTKETVHDHAQPRP